MSKQTEEFDNREDMENIGRAFMATIARNLSGYSWLNCPSESIVDLINERDALQKELADAQNRIETDGRLVTSLEQSLAAAQADAERMRKELDEIKRPKCRHRWSFGEPRRCLICGEPLDSALAMKKKP